MNMSNEVCSFLRKAGTLVSHSAAPMAKRIFSELSTIKSLVNRDFTVYVYISWHFFTDYDRTTAYTFMTIRERQIRLQWLQVNVWNRLVWCCR